MNNKRGKVERWLDKHNHKMELIRTIIPLAVLILQIAMFMSFISQKEKVVVVEKEIPIVLDFNK